MSEGINEDEIPHWLCPKGIEKQVATAAQTLALMEELGQSAAWKWFMYNIHDVAWENIKRWIKKDILSEEDLQQRNLDMRQAKAMMEIPLQLEKTIARIKARIERERNPK